MSSQPHIVIVDDEPGLCLMVADYLKVQGYRVRIADGGRALDRLLAEQMADLILLDVNMPGEDGLSILARLRDASVYAGIIMLTAQGEETNRVMGLSRGADDYVVKPFELRELLARIRSVLRRVPQGTVPAAPTRLIPMGRHRLDLEGRRLLDQSGVDIGVSLMEYELLAAFARHPRQVLSRERLCELAHGRERRDTDRSVDIRIARIRKKIEPDPGNPSILRTIRGEGYMFDGSSEVRTTDTVSG